MDSEQLPLLMMLIFLFIIIFARVAFQFISFNDSGIRPGTRLRTKKEMCISFLMFGVVGVQTLLAWLYATSRLKPQLELGSLSVVIGLALCVIGIAFSSYAQHKMGKEWRIGVDPNEKTELVTTGIYKLIRNPIYTGCIVHGTGLIILAPHLLFLITGLVGYFAVQAYVKDIEEPYLIEFHGDKYRQYMSQTGSFFPRFMSGWASAMGTLLRFSFSLGTAAFWNMVHRKRPVSYTHVTGEKRPNPDFCQRIVRATLIFSNVRV